MRLPCTSSPRIVLSLLFFLPLLSLIIISALSTLSSLTPESLDHTPTANTAIMTSSTTSSTNNNTATPPMTPTVLPRRRGTANRDAHRPSRKTTISTTGSPPTSASNTGSTSKPYHIAGSRTTTPLATMPSTSFPGPRCTETCRSAMALSKRSGVSLNGWRGEREDEEPLRSRDIASAIHHHLPTETDVQSSSAPRQEEVRVIILLRDGNETENWTGIGTDNRSSNAGHGRQDEMLQTWGWGVETADDSSNLMKLLGGLMMGLAW